MTKSYFKTLLSLILLAWLFAKCDNSHTKQIQLHKNDQGITVSYNKQNRLCNGHPGIEDLPHFQSTESTFTFHNQNKSEINVNRFHSPNSNIFGFYLNAKKTESLSGKKFTGFFFDSIPNFQSGVEIWRYKPWNSWTKPIKITDINNLHSWDIQFFYWQYNDGLYGAAIPLSGNGYRTTLGSENGKFGCKALTYTKACPSDTIPMMAIGFGEDPHKLFKQLYQTGLTMMGHPENIRSKKKYPQQLENIGWCTWNSSDKGKNLNEQHLIKGVESFTTNNFPLGWLLVDDGWFDSEGGKLNSMLPDEEKFPKGFGPVTSKLKNKYGLKEVGVWHAYNGYWNGINAQSKLGRRYQDNLFSWVQKEQPHIEDASMVEYNFIHPDSEALDRFYNIFHKTLADQGFTFVKVDNQLVSERMARNNYPIDFLSQKMHEALYQSVFKHFDGAVINCMDMTNDAFYHFGESAVARCVEDYFPEKEGGKGYNLEKGGAAAHVLSALYNALYFSQMVWPDYDMFESHNTHAWFHAAARAISGGPVYVTDKPGKQNFDVLSSLVNNKGKILRTDVPGLVTEDCIMQVDGKKPLKVYSHINNSGILAVFNAADSDSVEGHFSISDIKELKGDSFACYEFFSKKLFTSDKSTKHPLSIQRMGCKYYNVVPIRKNVALIGLTNKFNAPATIQKTEISQSEVFVKVKGQGPFTAYLKSSPQKISINNKVTQAYTFENGKLVVKIPENGNQKTSSILIER